MNKLNCFIFTILFLSCNKNGETIKPATENITESAYASGIIKSKNQYQVYSTVGGIISKIFVTENDLVKAGSPLMTISDETSKLNLKNASLASDYADLNANREKLIDLKNNIALAQSKCSNDSLLYIRQQNLWSQNIGTRFELEQKELAYQNSKTALQSARIKYNDLLKQLEFNAAQSKNNLAITRYKENDLTIKSEIDGKVYSINKKRGEMVNPQTALATIGDATHFLLELQIDEYDIVKVKLGQKVLITMDSYHGRIFEATILKIDPLMDPHSKSFSVEAGFVSQPPVLYPNLTVEANIIIATKANALTIPRNYLVNDSLVLIGKDKMKAVTTGLKDYHKVEIIKGLTANNIIYKPQQ